MFMDNHQNPWLSAVEEDPEKVFRRKGIEGKGEGLEQLIGDIVRRGKVVDKKSIITDLLFSVYGKDEDNNKKELHDYKEDRINLNDRILGSEYLAQETFSKEQFDSLEDIDRKAVNNIFNEDIHDIFRYSNKKFSEFVKKDRKGENDAFVHSFRVAKYLRDKGFSGDYLRVALLHDIAEDSSSRRVKDKKNKEREIIDFFDGYFTPEYNPSYEERKEGESLREEIDQINKHIKNPPEYREIKDKFSEKYAEYTELLTNTSEGDTKLGGYNSYLNNIIDYTENKKDNIGLAVKFADCIDNTEYIWELDKEKKDMRLEKNKLLLDKTKDYLRKNDDKSIKDLASDLIETSIKQLEDMKKGYVEKENTNHLKEREVKEYKTFIHEYEKMIKEFSNISESYKSI
ncbi:MAG: hypothetical protein ACQEP1_06725 [Nanobdellota archaeon]